MPTRDQYKNIKTKSRSITRWLLVAVVLGVAVYLVRPGFNDLMPVENVRIDSTFKHLSLSSLRTQVVDVLSGGYFTVDIDLIRNTLLELPWVEEVSVRRQWPSGLHIRVIEKNAVAYWGGKALLSDQGEVFKPDTIDRNQALPHLEGPEGLHKVVWSFMREVSQSIEPMGLVVNSVSLDERRSWSLGVTNESIQRNIEVRLGRKDTQARLARFIRVFSYYPVKISSAAYIDLRYPNGFAMSSYKTTALNNSKGQGHARERGAIT